MAKEKEINIQKHSLVPKHVILKQEDVDKLLKKYNITLGQLPKISIKDPMVKLLDAKDGEVIKITRKSETNIKSPYYRVVISE